MQIILLKLIFALLFSGAMAAAYVWLERKPALVIYTSRILLAAIGLRLLLFVLVFMIIGLPFSSDMRPYRYEIARAAAEGKLPYQDFELTYAPLFPYLFVVGITDAYASSALNIAALITGYEILSLLLTWRLIRTALDPESAARWLLLYGLCPLPYVYSVLSHQDETWLLAVYEAAILPLLASQQRRNTILAGMILGLGGLLTKSTTALPLGLLLIFTQLPGYFVLGMALTCLLFAPLLIPIFPEMITSLTAPTWADNPSIWYGVQILTRQDNWVTQHHTLISSFTTLITFLTAAWLGITAYRHQLYTREPAIKARYFLYAWLIVWLVFSLLTSKGIVNYLLFWMAAAIFLLVVRPSRGLLAMIVLFSVIGSVHTSLTYRWLPVERYTDLTDPRQLFVLSLDMLLYGMYLGVLWHTVKQMQAEFRIKSP